MAGATVTSGGGSTTTDAAGITHVEQHLFAPYATRFEHPAYPDYHFFGVNGGASTYASDGAVVDDATLEFYRVQFGLRQIIPPRRRICW